MNNLSRFGAIYQIQQNLAGNLSKIVVRNAKVDVTVGRNNFNVQNYAAVHDGAKLLQNKHDMLLCLIVVGGGISREGGRGGGGGGGCMYF